jgi:methyl-accepting chemotaxis protein
VGNSENCSSPYTAIRKPDQIRQHLLAAPGLMQGSKINDMLNSMYDYNLVPIADVANANMQAIYHHRAMLTYVAEPDREVMKRIEAEAGKNLAKMKE